jgi:hypothetical protein
MAPEQRRRLQLGLVVIGGLVVLWQYMGGETPSAPPRASAARAAQAAEPPPPADVRLDDLSATPPPAGEVSRNPFVFGARAAAPTPVRTGPARDAGPPPAPVVFVPPGPPPVPPIPFKFIGLVEGAAGARIAVLSDSKGLVVHGGVGAIIDGRFRILAIGAETIDIAYADGRGRQTLRLTGQ